MSEPAAPMGIVIRYRDGTEVRPDGMRYLGFNVDGRGLHTWVVRLPRPLTPGLAEVCYDVLPPRTEVICE